MEKMKSNQISPFVLYLQFRVGPFMKKKGGDHEEINACMHDRTTIFHLSIPRIII